MRNRRGLRTRRTDVGTVVLHGFLIAAVLVALLSGMRIATESPDHAWINVLDLVLPTRFVWTAHMPAAMVLVGITLAYPFYISRRPD